MKHVLNLKNTLLILSIVLLTYGLAGIGSTHTDTGEEHIHEETATRAVEENKKIGSNVGAAFTVHEALPTTDYVVRNSGENTASEDFSIVNSDDGLQLVTNARFNHEDKSSYQVILVVQGVLPNVLDSSGNEITGDKDTVAVTINIDDVNEKPKLADDAVVRVHIDEGLTPPFTVWSPAGNIIDPDEDDTFKVMLVDVDPILELLEDDEQHNSEESHVDTIAPNENTGSWNQITHSIMKKEMTTLL